jgi:hypothetical protein
MIDGTTFTRGAYASACPEDIALAEPVAVLAVSLTQILSDLQAGEK